MVDLITAKLVIIIINRLVIFYCYYKPLCCLKLCGGGKVEHNLSPPLFYPWLGVVRADLSKGNRIHYIIYVPTHYTCR